MPAQCTHLDLRHTHTKHKEDFELNTCCASEVCNLITAFTYYFNMAHQFMAMVVVLMMKMMMMMILHQIQMLFTYVAEVTDLNYD